MSRLLKSIRSDMQSLHNAGLVSDTTMKEFDAVCLTKIEPLSPEDIKKIRQKNHVSQAVFARYLNMSPTSVQKWERGEKKPQGAALKLLMIVKAKGIQAIA